MANTKNYFIKANVRNQSRRDPRGLDLTSDALAVRFAVVHQTRRRYQLRGVSQHNGDLKDL